ncbi:hypothetical protein CSB20_04170 [bacterium DOLZORAL124_64_63]|nr:MAG: hypothetical protein CSB20_04170 [bacterium DOLZORAL124_64_63]
MSALRIKSLEFRREREQDWQELERLIAEAEKRGLQNMAPQDVARLPVYYRAALSSLSVARTVSLDANLLLYLENLANRAFIRMYGVRHHLGEAFLAFLIHRFPAALRAQRGMILLACAFFLLGTGTGYMQVQRDPDTYYHILPTQLAEGRNPAATTEELRATLFDEEANLISALNHFASYLFTHNARVGILSFALGIFLGLPVYYLMFINGQILGAMSALFLSRGLGVAWFGWILPHGITELSAIFICGGGGLALAWALILPGRSTRQENLARAGRQAGILVLGAVGMLVVAALIEGLFRQLVTNTTARYLVAAASLVLWTLYFTRVGRREPS